MGACRFCGKTAGFFSTEHSECKEKHEQAPALLSRWADELLGGHITTQVFEGRLKTLQQTHHLRPEEIRSILATSVSQAGERFLQDGLLSQDEEALLREVQRIGGMTMDEMATKEFILFQRQYGLSRLEYAALLRDTLFQPTDTLAQRRTLGKMMAYPDDPRLGPPLPFRLAADEFLANIEEAVVYCKTKTTRHYEGTSQGVSVRLGAGMYYRIGAFKGQPVDDTQLQRVDIGRLAYSNRALYYWGDAERIRLSYDGILSWEPNNDTITIWRDRASAKPEAFRGDPGFGWYMVNVIANHQLMDRDLDPGQTVNAPLKVGAELKPAPSR